MIRKIPQEFKLKNFYVSKKRSGNLQLTHFSTFPKFQQINYVGFYFRRKLENDALIPSQLQSFNYSNISVLHNVFLFANSKQAKQIAQSFGKRKLDTLFTRF